MIRKRLLSLTALCVGVAPAALAQEALPDIDVGAPLRSRSRPVSRPAAPVHAAAPAPVRVAAPKPAAKPAPVHVAARKPTPKPRPAPAPIAAPPPAPAPTLSRAPSSVIITSAQDIANTHQFDIGGALERATPGVSINDVEGNPFAPEIDYRGFVASPDAGTPQGLAVYQNGARINEAFGDTVNWDMIPAIAIDRAAVVSAIRCSGSTRSAAPSCSI